MFERRRVIAVLLTVVMVFGLFAALPSPAFADTVGPHSSVNGYDDPAGGIYVATSGNDATATGSRDKPYKSINTALTAAPAGSTIILRGGTYQEGDAVRVRKNNITIKSAKGEWAVIDLTNIPADSELSAIWFHPENTITGQNVTGCKIQGLEVRGGFYNVCFDTQWDYGNSYRGGASNNIIEDCVLHDSKNDCVKLKPNCDNITIRYCEIYNSGRSQTGHPDFWNGYRNSEGIDNVNGDNMHAHHNYIHDICSTGIYAKGGATDAIIEYNRVERTNAAGIQVGFDSNLEYFDTTVNPQYYENIRGIARYNLIIDANWEGIGIYAAKDVQIYNNTIVNAKAFEHNAIYFGFAPQDGDMTGSPPSTNVTIRNNVISLTSSYSRPLLLIRYVSDYGGVSCLTGMPTMSNNCYYIASRSATFTDNRPGSTLSNGSLAAWKTHIGGDSGSIEVNPSLNSDYIATNSACAGMGIQTPLTVGGGGTITPPPSSSKDITSLSINGASGSISGTAISVTLPAGSSVTSLTPVIVHTGVSIAPTGARNFSSPVTYTITAADGSTKSYTVTVTVTPSNPGTGGGVPAEGLYTISPKCTAGMVLDIAGGSTASGGNVQTWYDNTTAAQTFRLTSVGSGYYTLTNIGSGMLLDVNGAGQASGTNVHQWGANSTAAQKWQLIATPDGDGSYYLKSACNGLYLDITGASGNAGANVQVFSGNSTNAQKFYFKAITQVLAPGNYVIISRLSSSSRELVADVSGGSTTSGANVQIWVSNGTGAQRFRFAYNAANGYYTITNTQSGLALDVAGANSASGTNVWQYTPNNTRAQWWRVIANGDGSYRIVSATGGCVLDVSGANTASGANIQIYSWNGTNAQKWTFKPL